MTPDFHFGQMFFLKDLHQIKLQSDSKVAKVAMVAAVKDCEQCLACVSHLCNEVAGGKVAFLAGVAFAKMPLSLFTFYKFTYKCSLGLQKKV